MLEIKDGYDLYKLSLVQLEDKGRCIRELTKELEDA